MIRFTDGTSLTGEEAAQLVESEGRLITDHLINPDGERCAGGVLVGSTQENEWPRHLSIGHYVFWSRLIDANHDFQGTPEERAVYMAQWLRNQDNLYAKA